MTGRTLAVDYPVATPQADFVIKAPAEWTNVQCTLVGDNLIVLVSGNGLFDTDGKAKDASFDVVVTPRAPYSLVKPTPLAILGPGAQGQDTFTYEGSKQDSEVEIFEFEKPEGTPKIHLYVVPVMLKSIGFDNTIGDIVSDDGTVPYISPQWQDGNHDGTVFPGPGTPSGDHNYPVGFVRNTKPELTDKTVVKLGGPLPAGVTLYLTAESNPNGVNIEDAELQVDGTYRSTLVDAPVESTEVLHDSINYYDSGALAPGRIFQVDWKVRLGGGNFLALAETRHTLYKTADLPIPGTYGLRESMVYYACFGGRQADPGSTESIADSIQDRVFSTKAMSKVKPCRAEMQGAAILEYKESYSADYIPNAGGGQCGGWAGLFRDTVRIHGRSDITKVKLAADSTILFDVPLSSYEAQLTGWLVRHRTALPADGSTVMPALNPALDGGQGNAHTYVSWGGHSIAGIQGASGVLTRFYDPSYGSGPFASMPDYEARGIACFYGLVPSALGSYDYYWPDRGAIPEIIATPDSTP